MRLQLKGIITLLASGSAIAGLAVSANADPMPPEQSLSALEVDFISPADLYDYKALDSYSEAPFLTDLVQAGKLPPVEERLPKEPLVFKTSAMSDGIGEYGGVFRHVIGGRPQSFHWLSGQHSGNGGIDLTMQECLTREGPMWQIKPEEQNGPLPNLAKSWDWNEDKTSLTLHLIEGAKWSDGDPFDAEDVRFWYEDNVKDTNVTSRMRPESLGISTELVVVDDYTIRFDFQEPKSNTVLLALAYNQGCPGPSHVLKEHHPRYNSDKTYEDYHNALPHTSAPIPVMGSHAPVLHKPDEIVILRRNPYYWKVDESGQQLPYHNEIHYKLTTWDDRTTQAIAGTGDFSNMENPANFVEVLKQSQSADAPVSARFGPRTLAWRLEMNFAANTATTDYDRELREMMREKDFRVALSHALDRNAIGQAIARGPFAYPHVAGFVSGSPYYTAENSIYHPYDMAKASELLDSLGLTDTDGDGIRNLPGVGENLTLDVIFQADRNEFRKQLEAITAQFADVGIRVLPKPIDSSAVEAAVATGEFNVALWRRNQVRPTYRTCQHLPISDSCPVFHKAGSEGRDLMDFEVEVASLYNEMLGTDDPEKGLEITGKMQQLLTENVYTVGTIQIPAALLVNKRIRNAHPGTPVFLYQWAEDGVIRERLWTPKDAQLTELMPGTIAEY